MFSELKKATPEDSAIVAAQLGGKRARLYSVAARCRYNYPTIAVFNPFGEDGDINAGYLSTPIWLTCPFLNDRLHDFESLGYITSITDLLASDQEIFSMMKEAHAHYYFMRKELFRVCTGKAPGDEVIKYMDKGIGGMINIATIKCLHLHYSHYRFCSYNVAGMIASKLIGEETVCSDCRCSQL